MGDKKPPIVIIGANDFQNRLIHRAKQLGYETHVFAWKDGSIGERTADFFYPISIVNREEILDKCREIQPVGVTSIASDLAVSTVSYLTEHLSLCGITTETARVGSNKALMRERFAEQSLPSPRHLRIDKNEINDVLQHIKQYKFNFPLIVKPTDRSGSRGVTKVISIDEILPALNNAFQESFSSQAVIEEFIEGDEYSIEYISFAGVHHFLAATRKYVTGSPNFIETGHLQPSGLADETIEKVKIVAENVLDALELKYGASHTEIKITASGEIFLIESGMRMGGDFIGSDLVFLSTGYDYLKMVIDTACGKSPCLEKQTEGGYACVRFVFNKDDANLISACAAQYPESIEDLSLPDTFDNRVISDSSARYGYGLFFAENMSGINKILTALHMGTY